MLRQIPIASLSKEEMLRQTSIVSLSEAEMLQGNLMVVSSDCEVARSGGEDCVIRNLAVGEWDGQNGRGLVRWVLRDVALSNRVSGDQQALVATQEPSFV